MYNAQPVLKQGVGLVLVVARVAESVRHFSFTGHSIVAPESKGDPIRLLSMEKVALD
jgi:hypothetical protein